MSVKNVLHKLKITVKSLVQRLFITLQLFLENGLANHAAAGAYDFLLSVAPMLLLIAFFILAVFKPSPRAIASLLGTIPFLDIIFDEQWLTGKIFSVSMPGISGVISVLSIYWAGRILALSMQRGLKIIFPGTKSRNPVTDTLVTLTVEVVVLVFVLMLLFGSQTALHFYRAINFFPESSFMYLITSKFKDRIFPIIALGLGSLFIHLFVPVNSPRKVSAFWGALLCALAYGCLSMALEFILDQTKYNFLYGALGNLIILLVNVYFFFTFFFLGAQLAFVIDSFDALLFSKLRKARFKTDENGNIEVVQRPNMINRLFFNVDGKLNKYSYCYNKGDTIFLQGDTGDDIFYLLEGKVEIFISSSQDTEGEPCAAGAPMHHGPAASAGVLKPGSFFGEMGYLLSENRTGTAMAKTDVSALALPSSVFDQILEYDTDLDRTIIEYMSHRLKIRNEQLAALTEQ
jgi:membrane protein